MSADPALDKYLPSTQHKERETVELSIPTVQQPLAHFKLPGMGGIYSSLNLGLYTYAHLNPLKFTDPDGRLISSTLGGAQKGVTLDEAVRLGAPGNAAAITGFAAAGVGATAAAAGVAAGESGLIASVPAVIGGLAKATTAAAKKFIKNLDFDGPSPGLAYGNGRIAQIRWKSKPLIRLDYHPMPGSNGESRLHLNVGKKETHISMDPRSLKD